MTETALVPSPQAVNDRSDRSPPLRVGGKLRQALLLMVWEGLPYNTAAERCNLRVHSMREALERPHVLAFIRSQKQVMRTAASGANILALTEVRDQRDNQMARVQAVKALEQLSDTDQARGGSAPAQPGLTIQIITNSSTKPTINANGDLIDE
jgi:hypothetical protein